MELERVEGEWLVGKDEWIALPIVQCPDDQRLLTAQFIAWEHGVQRVLLSCPFDGARFEYRGVD